MAKYRKKTIVIDAVQWWPPWHALHVPIAGVEKGPRDDQSWGVMTLGGFIVVSPGDWIITGVKGEKYPCKADIFAATYDAVPESVDAAVEVVMDSYRRGKEMPSVLANHPERVEDDDGN